MSVSWRAVDKIDGTIGRLFRFSRESYALGLKHPNADEELTLILNEDTMTDLANKLCDLLKMRAIKADGSVMTMDGDGWSNHINFHDKVLRELEEAKAHIARLEAASIPIPPEQLAQAEGDAW